MSNKDAIHALFTDGRIKLTHDDGSVTIVDAIIKHNMIEVVVNTPITVVERFDLDGGMTYTDVEKRHLGVLAEVTLYVFGEFDNMNKRAVSVSRTSVRQISLGEDKFYQSTIMVRFKPNRSRPIIHR